MSISDKVVLIMSDLFNDMIDSGNLPARSGQECGDANNSKQKPISAAKGKELKDKPKSKSKDSKVKRSSESKKRDLFY